MFREAAFRSPTWTNRHRAFSIGTRCSCCCMSFSTPNTYWLEGFPGELWCGFIDSLVHWDEKKRLNEGVVDG